MAAVSIHAPARGATSPIYYMTMVTHSFNPRARTGRDHAFPFFSPSLAGFNPRARTGRDISPSVMPEPPIQFQSTRPHGARPAAVAASFILVSFQSTRPHGARPRLHVSGHSSHKFQSTRPHGARRVARTNEDWAQMFQSTRPHGARLKIQISSPSYDGFNPRARTGRDYTGPAPVSFESSFNPRARTGRDIISPSTERS